MKLDECRVLRRDAGASPPDGSRTVLQFQDFLPGSVVAILVTLTPMAQTAVTGLRNLLVGLGRPAPPASSSSPMTATREGLDAALASMTLADMNVALYRCHQEEVEDGRPGSYEIPNFGPFNYCGLQGVMSLLSHIRPSNDLGHPLCGNLRDGDWLASYVSGRLQRHEGTAELGRWLEAAFNPVGRLPRYLVPCYFDAIVTGTYLALLERSWSLMSR